MTRAWSTQCENHTAKLVLLKLADNANDQGVCWPSLATIADECDLSRQGVIEQIEKLETHGFLSVERSLGGRVSNHYQVFPAVNAVDYSSQPRRPQQSTALTTAVNAVDPNHHITIKEPPTNREESLLMIRNILSDAFYRPPDSPWSYLEESTLAELVRERPKAERELKMMLEWRSKLEPEKRKFFPTSIHSLLSNWSKTLDRARMAFKEPAPQPKSASVF